MKVLHLKGNMSEIFDCPLDLKILFKTNVKLIVAQQSPKVISLSCGGVNICTKFYLITASIQYLEIFHSEKKWWIDRPTICRAELQAQLKNVVSTFSI